MALIRVWDTPMGHNLLMSARKKMGVYGPVGLGAFNPSGNNFLVDAVSADQACAGNFAVAPNNGASAPASILADLQAWADGGPPTGTSIFVWSGDDGNLYQFVKTPGPGYATLMICDNLPSGWKPPAVVNPGGGGGVTPGGGGGGVTPVVLPGSTPSASATASSGLSTGAVVAIGAVALVGGIAAAYLVSQKHGSVSTMLSTTRRRSRRGQRR